MRNDFYSSEDEYLCEIVQEYAFTQKLHFLNNQKKCYENAKTFVIISVRKN